MEKKYYEQAKVDALRIVRGEGGEQIIEASATLIVEKGSQRYVLQCFLGGGKDAERINQLDLKKGDVVNAEFYLLNFRFRKTAVLRKSLLYRSHHRYEVQGQIADIRLASATPKQNYEITLDCGIFLETNVMSDEKFGLGDGLGLEGRLDANIIGRAN